MYCDGSEFFFFQGIIITATTPTQSAVRLETGVVELQLSNRVENISRPCHADSSLPMKIFGKAQVRPYVFYFIILEKHGSIYFIS